GSIAARWFVVCRHQDLSARVADEAGSDEHGDFGGKPCAVSGSQAGGVHGAHARHDEAAWRDDEIRTAREYERRAAGEDFVAAEDGFSGADWQLVSWTVQVDRR